VESAQPTHGFFGSRQPLGISRLRAVGGKAQVEYANVPRIIGIIVSRRLATLYELQTIYGIEDAHDLLEVIAVDAENERE
jgi:hypothetical protein